MKRHVRITPSVLPMGRGVPPAHFLRVDTETGKEVPNEDIVKNFKVDTDTYVEVTKELENVALESTRTIDIDEFVQREEIDPRYIIRSYYLRPDGKVGTTPSQ
jgi:DNA end-binding protein Ku